MYLTTLFSHLTPVHLKGLAGLAFKKSRRKKLTSYMITCCLKSAPSVLESPETLVVQIEFRGKEDKKKEGNIMATSVHPDKFRGESLELEREPQELSEEDKLKVRSKL